MAAMAQSWTSPLFLGFIKPLFYLQQLKSLLQT